MLIKNNVILLKKRKTTGFQQKTRKNTAFGKIMAFDENHVFRDFRVSVIFYCP